jgi:nucleoside-triphosphatase
MAIHVYFPNPDPIMNNPVFIVSGSQGSGKTTFLKDLIFYLQTKGIRIAGFVAEGTWTNNRREKFDLVDLNTNTRIEFCTKIKTEKWDKQGNFYINPVARVFGERLIDPKELKHSDIVVIDEIGPFELSGKGWSAAFEKIIHQTGIPVIISVRESLLFQVTETWKLNVRGIFTVPGAQLTSSAGAIIRHLSNSL